ncbi:MAG: MBL fold metallo-hydrolase [Deltaproteobacteria bacterium]|nr:MBL fold metallo-hydrolase [Deltaproteobacteria bacterium]
MPLQKGCASVPVVTRPWSPPPASADDRVGVCPIISALSTTPHLVLEGEGGLDDVVLPVASFLVRAGGNLFLVDAGVAAAERRALPAGAADLVMGFAYSPAASVAAQLAGAGIRSAQLAAVLLTHAHLDHAGELEDLPGVPVVLSEPEAQSLGALPAPVRDFSTGRAAAAWQLLAARMRVVRFPEGPLAAVDILPGGAMSLRFTPGHTPGSMSVVVSSAGGTEVMLGDAALSARHVRDLVKKGPGGRVLDADPELAWRTVNRLHAWMDGHPDWRLRAAHDEQAVRERFRFRACARDLLR